MNMIINPNPNIDDNYHAAVVARDKAQEDVATAEATVQRSNIELAAAEAAVGQFDRLAHAVARHRADSVKAGKPASAALPANLLGDQQRQREAADYLHELGGAQRLLAGEVKVLKGRLEIAHQAVVNAAKQIMVREFESSANRLVELEAEMIPLCRDITTFLTSFVSSGPNAAFGHAVPAKDIPKIPQIADRYNRVIPDEAGSTKDQRRAALYARLQSLINGGAAERGR